MNVNFYKDIEDQINNIKNSGTFKKERVILSSQNSLIKINQPQNNLVINLCANNYLGLANDPRIIEAAKDYLDKFGFGCASVRFICGTQDPHLKLENKIANFIEMEDSILFSSCFDANGGVFESLFTKDDAIISDELNHASIIDGIRLCKAQRFRYKNNDMHDLELKLKEASSARFKAIVTDGVFSMDGIIADLKSITSLAEKYHAIVILDDSHSTGFLGPLGKGTHEFCDVIGKIDIITGTLGKALGGASGGFIAGKKILVDLLRQKARPYLFSNSLAPMIAGASLCAFDIVEKAHDKRAKLKENQKYFRKAMSSAGFDLVKGEHPIIPVMIYDEVKAAALADELLQQGIYVISFSYPVVPKGQARIRTQMSSNHTKEQLNQATEAFIKSAKKYKIIQ